MMLRWFGYALVGVVVVIAGMFGTARLMDGPLGFIPGGKFRSGEPAPAPASWAFVAEVETLEMQLDAGATSRTTWVLAVDEVAYIPAGLAFPPGKSWHLQAQAAGDAQLRIDGKLYPVTLKRIEDAALEPGLTTALESKYSIDAPEDAGYWFFAITSRAD